jgi:alpha-D-ribose 1-methylphosphonate 5-triphosphate synthase subunit PhnL
MSPRCAEIVRWFDLRELPGDSPPGGSVELPPIQPGQIANQYRHCALDMAGFDLPDAPVVDCLSELSLPATLALLSRLGLAEARTYLLRPSQLSDGQRYRLRLAAALVAVSRMPGNGRSPRLLLMDEFAAVLDRVSACVVARGLRKVISAAPKLSAVVATSHDDLVEALSPDVHWRCDFGIVAGG